MFMYSQKDANLCLFPSYLVVALSSPKLEQNIFQFEQKMIL